ncbi:MAG TPA: HAMP domain-containing sensor histidine kinase [Solirubrobacteraceae bacterium]|jgi:signal transduction histidine kinase|nr:HAMP domain-containing sensor histidine kinase [Solirubrobacteraceae bacterium]
MLRRPGALGLRGRIVGALLISTVATLAVAALALLPKLESQLRNEAQSTLVAELSGEQRTFSTLSTEEIIDANSAAGKPTVAAPADEPAPSTNMAAQDVNSLDKRVGGTVSLYSYPLILIASSGPTGSIGNTSYVTRAFQTGHTVTSFGSGANGDVAKVAVPIPSGNPKYVLAASRPITEIRGAVDVVRNAFLYAALAGIGLTLILGIPLSATLLRRLQRLRNAAIRLAQGGPTIEIPVDRAGDEVGDLTRTFAIMQRRVAQQEEARRAFVSTASHELRTPLASLHGMLELLDDDLRDPAPDLDDARRLLARARAQSRRLGRLASDLLDLSRLDAEIELRSEPVELGELSRAVLAEFEPANAERGISARLGESAGACWALADPGSVAQILRILLDNASHMTAPGSEIRVTLHDGEGPVAISVADQGPGVAPDERELIFERFHRGRETGGSAGFGLGLAIGRELAERMGGELILEDRPGPGATFTLRLPGVGAHDEDPETVHVN